MKEKIYITALHMKHGGVEMAITLLGNAFVKKGYEVEILCVYNLGEPAYELDPRVKITYLTTVHPNREAFLKAKGEKNVVKLIKEGLYSLKVLYLKRECIKRAVRSIEKGIIISTRNEHSVILSKYGNDGVYKIAQLHHDHGFEKKYLSDFQKNYLNIDKFVLLTPELQKEVEETLKGNNSRTECVTIPNFLESVKQEVDLDAKEKTIVTVGRLHPVKGFGRLIECWKTVSEKHGEWKLKIIGGGELEEELRNKISELGLNQSVELAGQLDHGQVIEEMKKASLYVMTSYSEAFPFVLIEAMSSGLPVAAFDVRVGPRAIVDDGEDGFLIEDCRQDAFSEKVSMLIENSKERMRMSRNAMKKAACFSEEEVMKKWMALIDRK